MSVKKIVLVEDREITLSNLTKKLWPDYNKAQFIEYYTQAAPYILPYLVNRPISLVRYPNGIGGKFFYQKDKPQGTPEWVKTYPVYSTESQRIIEYLLINDLPTLVWVANLAAIELNPWHSRHLSPDTPDWTVIDLDPAEPAGFSAARKAALLAKEVLDHLGLVGYPKLSGATGIHIYLRLPADYTYQQSADLVGFIGRLLLNLNPELITTQRLVKKRTGKVYVDHLQNLKGKTIVAPYSLRPRASAPVSMPVTWAEIASVWPDDFTLRNFPTQVKRHLTDPFKGILQPLNANQEQVIRNLSQLAQTPVTANI